MANHRSAIKKTRQDERKRLRNRFYKTRVKNVIKAVREAIESKSVEEAEKALAQAVPVIAKAASKGIFHKRKAARKISRLSKKVNSLKQSLSQAA